MAEREPYTTLRARPGWSRPEGLVLPCTRSGGPPRPTCSPLAERFCTVQFSRQRRLPRQLQGEELASGGRERGLSVAGGQQTAHQCAQGATPVADRILFFG